MKIAAIMLTGLLCLASAPGWAQSAPGTSAGRSIHTGLAKDQRSGPAASRDASAADRAADAEMKRVNRMMTICTGC